MRRIIFMLYIFFKFFELMTEKSGKNVCSFSYKITLLSVENVLAYYKGLVPLLEYKI